MKIAILSTFFPFRGGIAQFAANMFRVLEKDHEVKAFTFKRQYPNFLFPGKTQYVTEKDQADRIPSIQVLDSINPFTYRTTAKRIKEFQPDVLIVKYWMPFFAPSFGFISKKLKKTKRICILHNFIPHEKRFFDAAFNKYFVKQIDGFVVMSDQVLSDLLRVKPDARYVRIDHPLYDHFGPAKTKEEACSLLKLDPTKKYVLFFGLIRDYKGLDLLIEAFNSVDSSLELIIAGEAYGAFDKYEELIQKYQLGNRVHLFNHYITDDEVSHFFSAADVCVLPYKSATQSGITTISYHFNLPVIVSGVGGLSETVKHGETGLIVDEINPEAIAKSINYYFESHLKEAFFDAIQQFKQEHSWEAFSRKMLDFIDGLKK